MNAIWKKIYNAAGLIKVFCAIAAAIYLGSWILFLAGFPYMASIDVFLGPFANVIRFFADVKVTFMSRPVDMTYVICAVVLLLVYPFFSYIASFCANLIEKHELALIAQRERDVKSLNEELTKEYQNEILSHKYFIILLKLNLKPVVDTSLLRNPINFNELQTDNYIQIKQLLHSNSIVETELYEGSLYFLSSAFSYFDKFLPDLIKAINIINEKNKGLEVETSFTLTIDAIQSEKGKSASLDLMSKISNFNYKNRAIATGAFVERYGFEDVQNFSALTAGLSRLFDKNADRSIGQKYTDIELYSLKKKR